MDLDDALRRAQGGDSDAMGQLYRTFASPMLSYLATQARSREDAEDLLGEVFLSAMRDLPRFEGDASGLRAWLYRIATNRAIDLARRQMRRPESPLEEALERASADDPEAEAVSSVERARVWAAIATLPALQQAVVGLRLGAGLSTAEIAEVLGKRIGAIKALQHRAMIGLARVLAEEAEPYPGEVPERFEH